MAYHPWHDVELPRFVEDAIPAIIEIPTGSKVKYELDKRSGLLLVDRILFSAVHYPANYGFVPRTYCGPRTKKLSPRSVRGDGDPLDICVLSERPITRGEVLVRARVVGGLQMVDAREADDKIVAVLDKDWVYGEARDIGDLPRVLVERLEHYFLTYKLVPGQPPTARIDRVYGRAHAERVVRAAMDDYREAFGG